MINHNDVSIVPGDAIIGMATIGMPPFSSAGYWFEVDDGNLISNWTDIHSVTSPWITAATNIDSDWVDVKPTNAFVIYKGDQNGS